MRLEEKKMIWIIILVVIVIIGGIFFIKNNKTKEKTTNPEENTIVEPYVNVLADGTKLNTSNQLSQTKQFEGIQISNMQLTHKNGKTVLLATVTNKTNKDIELTPITLTLYDDKNNILETVNGLISPVKVGQSVQLNVGISKDYANAYDFIITKK